MDKKTIPTPSEMGSGLPDKIGACDNIINYESKQRFT